MLGDAHVILNGAIQKQFAVPRCTEQYLELTEHYQLRQLFDSTLAGCTQSVSQNGTNADVITDVIYLLLPAVDFQRGR